MELKVGDKVRCIKKGTYAEVGELGTIKQIINEEEVIVCWNNNVGGWDDEELNIKNGHGEYTYINRLELVKRKCDKLIFRDNATILLKDGNRYVSKCQPGDTYDREKGLLLCLAKANGYTYNDICEMLNNAEYQGKRPDTVDGVREVKRPAKVGEYVKVVNSTCANGYKNGDILKIVKVCDTNFNEMWYYYCDERGGFLYEDEYVVLENYKPYKITLSEFWANKGKKEMAIRCKTDNETNELLKAFDRFGQVWYSGDKYTELNMGGKDVCYTNNNKFYNYICHEEAVAINGKIKIYEFNEVDLSK